MKRLLHTSYYFCIALLLVAVLFRIQHWPYAVELLLAGKIIAGLFFLQVIIEMLRSRKATQVQKLTYSIIYLAAAVFVLLCLGGFLLLLGVAGLANLYFHSIRKQFFYTRAEIEKIQFDSI